MTPPKLSRIAVIMTFFFCGDTADNVAGLVEASIILRTIPAARIPLIIDDPDTINPIKELCPF
jgi:hypothetical protein